MSAYQVSPATIDLMVSAAIELKVYARFGNDYREVTADNAQTFGAMLWDANAASIAYRYREANEPDRYAFSRYIEVKPAAALGCARCYDYQACEPNDYQASDACYFVRALIAKIADRLAGETPWGVESAAQISTMGFGRPVYTPRRSTAPAPRAATTKEVPVSALLSAKVIELGRLPRASAAPAPAAPIAPAKAKKTATPRAPRRAPHPALARFAMIRPANR